MALAPARLLLPVRAVDPAHPSALSSASVCSAAGAYPHFSLFFLHPPTHRSTPPVSATVSEAPSYRHNRHSQSIRQPGGAAPFDDLQSVYEEERGRSSYSSRNPNGKAYPAQRYGRGGGNSSRTTWEPSKYMPWRSRGGSEGERYGKPWSSQGRGSSSWASQAEDMPGAMNRQQTTYPRNGNFDRGSRNAKRTTFASPQGRADDESGAPPWERQGSFSRQGGGGAYNDRRNSPWEQQGSFSRQGGAYKDSRNSPWEKQGSFSRQGSVSRQGEQSARQSSPWQDRKNSPWQDKRREVSWEGAYSENAGRRNGRGGAYQDGRNSSWEKQGSIARQGGLSRQGERSARQSAPWQDNGREASSEGGYIENPGHMNGRSQRPFNGDVAREKLSSQSRNSSLKWQGANSRPSAPCDYSLTPWQRSSKTEREEEEEEEESYVYTEANAEREGMQDQSSSSRTDVSPIARIMERLRNIDDTASAQGPREGGRHPRGGPADHLILPSAQEYLSDRTLSQPPAQEPPRRELDNRFPWEIEEDAREGDTAVERARRLRPVSSAELTISASELKRLRILSVHLKQRVKVGKRGVTTDLVNSIKQRFHTCEVVKVKCEGPPAGNMKKTLENLEQRTGGLIIWKAGSVAVLYRGKNFGQPVAEIVDDLLAKKLEKLISVDGQVVPSSDGLDIDEDISQEDDTEKSDEAGLLPNDDSYQATSGVSLDDSAHKAPPQRKKKLGPEFEKLEEYTMEVEDILKDLGPRYEEWTGPQPIPVDGDLLPEVIPDFRPPYRLLPFGVKPSISNTLATHLRRLSRPLAPHFVIGRDRGLQGLSSAMVKLWEKSEIAKIGVKRGILNTNQERMVEDLKQLTGGFFLCRDKKSMTFYRGRDFLPQAVSAALAERQDMARSLQDAEESGRLDRSLKVQQDIGSSYVKPSWVDLLDPEEQLRLKKEAVAARRLQIVNHIERKINVALKKKQKAGRELEKVEELIKPVSSSDDKENVTDEERFMLRKLGLKMRAYLLMGRRGVFSGVVQNMHLHWKHRELVKIVVKEKDPVHLKEMASMLECESGGILISIDPTSKGYAIIYYRGKNYRRPAELRPPNLLTKRLALKRSLEIQRRLSLSKHIQTLEQEIVHLRAGLSKVSSESSEHQVVDDEGADAQGSLKHDGQSDNQPSHIQSTVLYNEKQEEGIARFAEEEFDFSEDEDEMVASHISKRKLRKLCEIGPIFRAVRLSNTERNAFRNEVLNLSKAAQYLVGRSNPLSTVAKAIRLYFLDHAFIKIGVKKRPLGSTVQDITEELEDLTGGTVYAQDSYQLVLYRGWPTGAKMPLDDLYDVLSPEQCDVLEDGEDDDDNEDEQDDEGENTVKDGLNSNSTFAGYAEKASGKKNDEDLYAKDEVNIIKEGEKEPMIVNIGAKNMNFASDEEDDDDSQWESLSDEDTEDDDDEEEDGDDDLRWVGLSDGEDAEEEEEEGDEVLMMVDTSSNKHSERISDVETAEGEDFEGYRWDNMAVGDNQGGIAGASSLNFDLDEDV